MSGDICFFISYKCVILGLQLRIKLNATLPHVAPVSLLYPKKSMGNYVAATSKEFIQLFVNAFPI